MKDLKDLREKLATLEYQQFVHLLSFILSRAEDKRFREKWEMLRKTSYNDLSEEEKDKYRYWADNVIIVLQASNILETQDPF